MTNTGIDVQGGLQAVRTAVSEVARGLARAHGQRQFYSLAQVQAQAVAAGVDAALWAWVFATLVTGDDFVAFFALRESPGGYRELRAAISAPEPRVVPPEKSVGSSEAELDELWSWLDLLRDL